MLLKAKRNLITKLSLVLTETELCLVSHKATLTDHPSYKLNLLYNQVPILAANHLLSDIK